MLALFERSIRNDLKARTDSTPLPENGTRVECNGDYWGRTGTVVGHEKNLLGTMLVLVKLDPDPNNPTVTDFTGWSDEDRIEYQKSIKEIEKYIPGFYIHEVTVIT